MKKICVLCEDSKSKQFRANGRSAVGLDIIRNPMSQTGFKPTTHWFSSLVVTDEGLSKIMNVKNKLGYGIVEESEELDFLKKYNLKYIEGGM